MQTTPRDATRDAPSDVVICGGGLAGLLLARQLRRELPSLSVAVVEKTRRPLPDGCHKVGESSVEVASQHMRALGLGEYLDKHQIYKLGLRFFPGGGTLPLEQRTEIGPSAEPIVRSYQLDRGRFEHDLRGMLEEDGVRLVEGARVKGVALGTGGAEHEVAYEQDGAARSVRCRWVVDASGRAALLRKDMKLTRGTRHEASAGWFRVSGRFDINTLVPPDKTQWHHRPCGPERWRSTNHFMGPGYWAWVIPLSSGMTSIGVVIHEELHDFHEVSSLERCMDFLREHEPVLAAGLEGAEVKDFLCLRKYNHLIAKAWSPDRWAIVGEAGAFVDPLYSPGSDFITFANCFTTELMRMDLAGEDIAAQAQRYNAQYRAFVASTTELFRTAAPVYGHPQAMTAKIYWDNFTYWSYTSQYYQQEVWKWPAEQHLPYDDVGRTLVGYAGRVQALFRAWAELAPPKVEPIMRPIPAFPSMLVDAHIASGQKMGRQQTLEYVNMRLGQARELVGELLVRVLLELGPEQGRELLERVHFREWDVVVPPERLDLEALDARTRKRALSDVARDLDRNLGPPARHPRAREALELLAQGTAA